MPQPQPCPEHAQQGFLHIHCTLGLVLFFMTVMGNDDEVIQPRNWSWLFSQCLHWPIVEGSWQIPRPHPCPRPTLLPRASIPPLAPVLSLGQSEA